MFNKIKVILLALAIFSVVCIIIFTLHESKYSTSE